MRNSNHITHYQIRLSEGGGVSDSSTAARQCWCRRPTGDKSDWGDPHILELGLQVMGNVGGDQPQGAVFLLSGKRKQGGRFKAQETISRIW